MNNVPGVSHSQEEEETILLLFKHTLDDRVNLLPETELEVTEFSKKKKFTFKFTFKFRSLITIHR